MIIVQFWLDEECRKLCREYKIAFIIPMFVNLMFAVINEYKGYKKKLRRKGFHSKHKEGHKQENHSTLF